MARLKTYQCACQCALPQDGRIDASESGARHDLRVATYPTLTGAKVVLRLFDGGRGSCFLRRVGSSNGSALIVVLAVLAIVSILSVAAAQTVIRLRSELHHIEKKQLKRLALTPVSSGTNLAGATAQASKGVKISP